VPVGTKSDVGDFLSYTLKPEYPVALAAEGARVNVLKRPVNLRFMVMTIGAQEYVNRWVPLG